MRGASNSVCRIAAVVVSLVVSLGCDPGGGESAFQPDAGTGGTGGATGTGAAAGSAGVAGSGASPSDFSGPGPYAIGHTRYLVPETALRDRILPLNVWYPVDPSTITQATPHTVYAINICVSQQGNSTSEAWEAYGYDAAYKDATPSGAGPFPLVVVSAGLGCGHLLYLYLATFLARNGYVVAVPEHCTDYLTENTTMIMLHRTEDVSSAISDLLARSADDADPLHGVINPDQIALGGHSLGGYVAYALTGGDDEVCDALNLLHQGFPGPIPSSTCVAVAKESNIRAMFSMDGVSPALRYHELANIEVPSLILGQPSDRADQWMARPHAAINRSDSYRVDVTTADHLSFSNACDFEAVVWGATDACPAYDDFDPATLPTTHRIVNTYLLAFLNTVFGLEDDSAMLTTEYAVQHEPDVEFFESETCDAPATADEYTYVPHAGECDVALRDPPEEFLIHLDASTPLPGFQIQSGGYVVAGAWNGYASPVPVASSAADAAATTITPIDYSGVATDATELCAQGEVGAASDAGGSAAITWNVNQSQSGADADPPAVQTVAIEGNGITVQYSNPGGTELRVQIATPTGATDPAGRWCAHLSGLGGTETIAWGAFLGGVDDATQGCWNFGGNSPPAGTEISTLSLVAPGDVEPVSYDFCLRGIAQDP